jgi:hypothetical protein
MCGCGAGRHQYVVPPTVSVTDEGESSTHPIAKKWLQARNQIGLELSKIPLSVKDS